LGLEFEYSIKDAGESRFALGELGGVPVSNERTKAVRVAAAISTWLSRLKFVALFLGVLSILICGAERATAQFLVPSVDGSTASNGRVTRYNPETGAFLDLLFGPIDPQIPSVSFSASASLRQTM
jgi:hypothetical protein